MKNYAKVGSRKGRPAYRTRAQFRLIKISEIIKNKTRVARRKDHAL